MVLTCLVKNATQNPLVSLTRGLLNLSFDQSPGFQSPGFSTESTTRTTNTSLAP